MMAGLTCWWISVAWEFPGRTSRLHPRSCPQKRRVRASIALGKNRSLHPLWALGTRFRLVSPQSGSMNPHWRRGCTSRRSAARRTGAFITEGGPGAWPLLIPPSRWRCHRCWRSWRSFPVDRLPHSAFAEGRAVLPALSHIVP